MTLHWTTLLAILAMAGATVITRLAGLVVLRTVRLSAAARRVLDAIPPAVLMAVVAPTAFATGSPETLGCAATAIAATRPGCSAAISSATVAPTSWPITA